MRVRRDYARGTRDVTLRRDGARIWFPSVARTVFDVSGAGDTVIAVLSLALAARRRLNWRCSSRILPPVLWSRNSGRPRLRRKRSSLWWNTCLRLPFAAAVLDVEAAVRWREELRAAGRTPRLYERLFSTCCMPVTSRICSGPARKATPFSSVSIPMIPCKPQRATATVRAILDRAALLAALRCVDAVVGFWQRTPEVLLDRIAPDVHVKSAQYRIEELPERIVVERAGGRLPSLRISG